MEGERGRSSPRAGRPAAARSETQMRSLCYAAWEGTRRGASPCGRASGLCMSTGWSNAGSCRSGGGADPHAKRHSRIPAARASRDPAGAAGRHERDGHGRADRKSTRLNSSHEWISYAVFCLKKKKEQNKNNELKKTIKENKQK